MLDTLAAARCPRRQRDKAERKTSSVPPPPPCVSISTERSAGDFGILAPDFVDKTMGVLRVFSNSNSNSGKKYGGHYRGAAKLSRFLFLSLPPLPFLHSSRLTVFAMFRVSSIKKKSFSSFFFFFSIKEEGEIEINRGLIIKSGY